MSNRRSSLSSAALSSAALAGCFVLVASVALAAYWQSFSVPFQFDDNGHIVNNETIRGHDLGEFLRFARTRIIPFTTLALNYWVGGSETFGYHVVNFLVHLLAILALYGLALALCRTPRLRDTWLAERQLAFATGAAFIFACHPLQVQAVTYIVQRMTAMAALFYVTAVYCYVRARNAEVGTERGRSARWYTGTGLCALAAFLSKENTASLPLALFLTEWIFYRGRHSRQSFRRVAIVVALLSVVPLVWWLLPQPTMRMEQQTESPAAQQQAEAPAEEAPTATRSGGLLWSIRTLIARAEGTARVSPLQYLFTQCVVVPRYLRLTVAPYGLNVDHDAPIVRAITTPVLAGAALLLTLILFGVFASSRWPLLAYGILWIFVGLSVESSILPIRDPMVEHRMYLAMPGVAFLAALAFAWLRCRVPALASIGGIAVVGALAVTTFMRNQVWQTPATLWGDAVEQAPNKARPHANLATALYHTGRVDQAIAHYCWALRLDPTDNQTRSNLNALSEAQIEKDAKSGKAFILGGELGADGTLELAPKDPCAGR